MSHFYGTVKGTNGKATRCGDKGSGMESYAASWQGAVKASIHFKSQTGEDLAVVELVPWHGKGIRKILYEGPIGGESERDSDTSSPHGYHSHADK